MSVCPIVWLDGEFQAVDDARISPFDRGFLFAHSAYEVTMVADGKVVDGAAHAARLERTLAGLEIPLPISPEELLALHQDLATKNGLEEGVIYLQVSSGDYGDRDFYGPENLTPTLFLCARTLSLVTDKQRYGVSVISVPDLRWKRRDYKTTQLTAPVLAYRAARRAGAETAVMHEEGVVTEAASANAWIVTEENEIITRQLSNSILPGITRQALLGLLSAQKVKFTERPFTIDEMMAASEAFTSSTGNVILPVVKMDGQIIGDGKPGPVTRAAQRAYYEFAGIKIADRAPWCMAENENV